MSLRSAFRLPLAVVCALCGASPEVGGSEQTFVLRMASVAPDGTAWAREMKAFAREVESGTNAVVQVKWFFGGIAGDEMVMLDRIRRGQLDGGGIGAACDRLAPSMRVTRLLGFIETREEEAHVIGRLKPVLDEEFAHSGFVNLGETSLGPLMLFTRDPVASMADLRSGRYWHWVLDEIMEAELSLIGIHTVPLPIHEAGRA